MIFETIRNTTRGHDKSNISKDSQSKKEERESERQRQSSQEKRQMRLLMAFENSDENITYVDKPNKEANQQTNREEVPGS